MSAVTIRRAAIRAILEREPAPPVEDIPAHLLSCPVFVAGENMPGYLPDSDPAYFATEREARGYASSLGRHRDYEPFVDVISLREALGGC